MNIEAALRNLEKLSAQADRDEEWGLVGSSLHYRKQLEELLSCDGGEAGLKQLASVVRS
jgi:hypothetical protein